MPEIAKYVHVNSFGTAQMLEVIREDNLPIKKIVVASSARRCTARGAATCPTHGLVFPSVRPVEQLRQGGLDGPLPALRRGHRARPHARRKPRSAAKPSMASPRSTRKNWSSSGASRSASPRSRSATVAPTARARASSTLTPGSSPSSARACSTACRPCSSRTASRRATSPSWRTSPAPTSWSPSPTPSTACRSTSAAGAACPVREVAEQISVALGKPIQPEVNGEFRPGEMRHLTSGTARIRDGVGYVAADGSRHGRRALPGLDSLAGRREGLLQRGRGHPPQQGHRPQGREALNDPAHDWRAKDKELLSFFVSRADGVLSSVDLFSRSPSA